MRVRIVHVITGLSAGGAEMMLFKLLSGMDSKKFDSYVISLTNKGDMREKIVALGVPVFDLKMSRSLGSLMGLRNLRGLIKSLKPDIIQGWMYHGNLMASLVYLLLLDKPKVVWNIRHSIYDFKYEKKLTAFIIYASAFLSLQPTKIIFNSKISAQQHHRLGYRSDKSVIIPNGFDHAQFKPQYSYRIRHTLAIADSAILIGLIARYHPIKDHETFFIAAGILARTHSQVRFVLAGRGVDSCNPVIARWIQQNGLEDRVYLLGERHDIAALTGELDIACSVSVSEGFPNAIGEAMSCAVPCVVTDVGDSAWLVGETGKIIPVGDAQALASAWTQLVDAGQETRCALGEAARQRIIDHFSLAQVVRRYEQLYDEVFAESTSKRV